MAPTRLNHHRTHSDARRVESRELIRLLGQHFGDRLVYLQGSNDLRLFKLAVEKGLITEDGYITKEGYRLWQRAG